jgi:hypothetical protein
MLNQMGYLNHMSLHAIIDLKSTHGTRTNSAAVIQHASRSPSRLSANERSIRQEGTPAERVAPWQ